MRLVYLALPSLLIGCSSLPSGSSPGSATPAGAEATLALLETTDLHANVLSYDYYKLQPDPAIGLERTATLIKQARAEYPNNLLLDNGDALQGTALADYQALVKPVACDETLAIYKAMNQLGVDGAGIGNHEFNYGLAYLNQVTGNHFDVDGVPANAPRCAGPAFPIVLANIYSAKSKQPLFAPYRILTRQIQATGPDGQPLTVSIKVGIIGFTPPGVLSWDKAWLEGKVYAEGVRESAQKYIPQMRAEGADLVVAISHGGVDGAPYTPDMENANYYLAQVPGVDALLIGHAHLPFPDAASKAAGFNLPGVDKTRGTIYGVPAVMANLWGKHLGVIGLHLRYDGKQWVVDKSRTTVEARATRQADGSYVAADPAIAQLVADEHAATIRYVKTPVGNSDFRMSSYFADVGDVSAIELVNQAQTAYVQDYVKANLPQYAALPVLSMASPFKTGSAGVADYTDVKPGAVALNNAADLYLYPNALHAVKVNGAQLKAWLEKSAERFNRIDPASGAQQELINTGFAGFNFDMLTNADVSYQIDVSQPADQRIVKLHYKGAPLSPTQEFLVATNNYRASGGGGFPGLDGSKTVIAAPDSSRDVLIAYIQKTKELTRARNGATRSWRFAPVAVKGPVVFRSAPGVLGLAREAGLTAVSQLKADDGKGYALYTVDLSK
ncbi:MULTISPECIES: bifunctional 2',3'-cyclic-nucleotide 2'-phosphodiesterase/3'-nucleotidase [unclassified Duganella]|uniref:bifunctional 2',3'-cyclic-nucleotide 2'-phosphodiesterase/3'-nucleotidase n=1 Tax=unclassified Duganella TaxID=2636909 RepID=UPI00088983DA|nr:MULTISPECIES: bifunctional 2',3'-cyclic-nucleotide 2'-phosphodiesterase/3'-nucleotidase [unclassified Duganella]SDG56451.1 2',3'-cyclic-nucleotide 2'-phosphodiesterase / 3'-nucleotidase [Duganella sp. OV458]SDJ79333.1 2',3'-cyclic-nucleotide 2'-phosphodiesterase / 3'-nucleotidase [Duganella sp. OV510]